MDEYALAVKEVIVQSFVLTSINLVLTKKQDVNLSLVGWKNLILRKMEKNGRKASSFKKPS